MLKLTDNRKKSRLVELKDIANGHIFRRNDIYFVKADPPCDSYIDGEYYNCIDLQTGLWIRLSLDTQVQEVDAEILINS